MKPSRSSSPSSFLSSWLCIADSFNLSSSPSRVLSRGFDWEHLLSVLLLLWLPDFNVWQLAEIHVIKPWLNLEMIPFSRTENQQYAQPQSSQMISLPCSPIHPAQLLYLPFLTQNMLLGPQTKDPLLRGFHLTDAVIQAHLVDASYHFRQLRSSSTQRMEKTAWKLKIKHNTTEE